MNAFFIQIFILSLWYIYVVGQSTGAHSHPRLENIQHRIDIADILEDRGYKVGVELGVQTGSFSKAILERWKSCEKYIMVDIWAHQAKNYVDSANVNDEEQNKLFLETKQNTAQWASKAVYYRNYTVDAAKYVADNSVDFIYVDARHDYCGVMEDIEIWYPKLKRGGLMAGHDYLSNEDLKRIDRRTPQDWSLCENGTVNVGAVKGAVNEFAAAHNIQVYSTKNTGRDGPYATWIYSPKHANNV